MKSRIILSTLVAALMTLLLCEATCAVETRELRLELPRGQEYKLSINELENSGELCGVYITGISELVNMYFDGEKATPGAAYTPDEKSEILIAPVSDGVFDARIELYTLQAGKTASPLRIKIEMSDIGAIKPKVSDTGITTRSGLAKCGNFEGSSPYGEVYYTILTTPTKGTLSFNNESGYDFVFTPYDKETGSDSFIYCAYDKLGNISETAEVSILIKESLFEYEDMKGRLDHIDAVKLAEKGILSGTDIGGKRYFEPDRKVTTGEFILMLVTASGKSKMLLPVSETGLSYDDNIPLSLKPYAAALIEYGVLDGGEETDIASPISEKEAVELMRKLFEIDGDFDSDKPLTRASAARLFGSIIEDRLPVMFSTI